MANQINCPICDSNDFKVVLKKDILTGEYTMVKCTNCTLHFINPLPSNEELESYYNHEYKIPAYQKPKVVQKSKKIITILQQHGLPTHANIFDLGASHGYFLHEAKVNGYAPYGVELSKEACMNALKNYGIEIDNAIFEDSPLSKQNDFFDAAVMLDVLEHLTTPDNILSGFNKILKTDGRIVLTLPNIDSSEFRLFGRYWEWTSPPDHLYYYSPLTIKNLLEKHGFEIEYLETFKGDSAGNIVFHFFISARQLVFYSLKYIIGRKKLLAMKLKMAAKMSKVNDESGKEFTGLSSIIYKASELFNPLLLGFDKKRYSKGHGPSILVLAKKKSSMVNESLPT